MFRKQASSFDPALRLEPLYPALSPSEPMLRMTRSKRLSVARFQSFSGKLADRDERIPAARAGGIRLREQPEERRLPERAQRFRHRPSRASVGDRHRRLFRDRTLKNGELAEHPLSDWREKLPGAFARRAQRHVARVGVRERAFEGGPGIPQLGQKLHRSGSRHLAGRELDRKGKALQASDDFGDLGRVSLSRLEAGLDRYRTLAKERHCLAFPIAAGLREAQRAELVEALDGKAQGSPRGEAKPYVRCLREKIYERRSEAVGELFHVVEEDDGPAPLPERLRQNRPQVAILARSFDETHIESATERDTDVQKAAGLLEVTETGGRPRRKPVLEPLERQPRFSDSGRTEYGDQSGALHKQIVERLKVGFSADQSRRHDHGIGQPILRGECSPPSTSRSLGHAGRRGGCPDIAKPRPMTCEDPTGFGTASL